MSPGFQGIDSFGSEGSGSGVHVEALSAVIALSLLLRELHCFAAVSLLAFSCQKSAWSFHWQFARHTTVGAESVVVVAASRGTKPSIALVDFEAAIIKGWRLSK